MHYHNMEGQILKLRLYQTYAQISENKLLNVKDIIASSAVSSFDNPAHWVLKVLKYNPEQKSIYVEVLNYLQGDIGFSQNQRKLFPQLDEIEMINFKTITTQGLLYSALGHHKQKTTLHLNGDQNRNNRKKTTKIDHWDILNEETKEQDLGVSDEPITISYARELAISWQDVIFEDQAISFYHTVDRHQNPI